MPPEAEMVKTTMILERVTVGHDVAYAMTWTNLKKKMTDKYCPRGEIKKLKVEMWNLKVKGTDVVSYNQRFQELTLMCARMFPEESDKIKRCKFHHNVQCTIKYANCKRVGGHLTRGCRSHATNNQRNLIYYECGNQRHYRSDCSELRKQNRGNQAGGTGA
nr:reverse transcriptase domain-containing protein [Tanacetum cinerariifolium]